MKKILIAVLPIVLALYACGSSQKNSEQQDTEAKKKLQGIWIDADSETAFLKIKGDTIYYADAQNASVYFEIQKDSLLMYGNEISHYRIDKLTEHIFCFHSITGNTIKLYRSDNEEDSLAFAGSSPDVVPAVTERTQQDSVVMYNGTRYRAYVYTNPTKIKVIKTAYSEDGISVDNVYYDNVMHICVYEGRNKLYSSDITKQTFKGVVPNDFLQKSILADMTFTGVNASGYHYQASLCAPASSVCYLVNLSISFDNELTLKLVI
ncbi:MAG: DUF4738 domain-containing protein [Bacteroides sp.]